PARRGARRSARLGPIEELKERLHVEQVLVIGLHLAEHPAEGLLRLLEDEDEHRHIAEGQLAARGAQRDPGVDAVERDVARQPERVSPHALLDRALLVLGVMALEDRAVALEEVGPEAEELDLLRVVLSRDDRLVVRLLASLGRAPREPAERGGRETALGEEERYRGEHDQDQREGSELPEQNPVREERDRVAREAKHTEDDVQRSVARAAARRRHLIGDRGILEVGQLERERLLQDALVDV